MTEEPAQRTVLQKWYGRLREALGVRPDEASALLAACLFQFSFVAGVAVLKSASNALLVGTESLPLLYVSSALATGVIAAIAVIARPTRRWPPTFTFATWTALLIALTALVEAEVPYAVDALYLAAEVYATTLSVRFWSVIGEIFDLRASRRMLGLIGGIGMAGSIGGGFLTRTLGESLGALRLVPLSALTLVVCLLVAPKIRALPRRASSVVSRAVEPVNVREYLMKDGLPRTMALLAGLAAIATALADFVFRQRAKGLFTSAEQAALFGGLSAVIGVVAMVMQLGLTQPLLKRVGLFGYLAITPLLCLGFAGAALVSPGLWPVYGLKAVEQMGALSLTQTGTQLLYGPMPDAVRAQARSAIDGFGKKAGYALGGLALLLLGTRATGAMLPAIVVGVALVTLVALARVRTHYIRTIGERLRAHSGENVEIAVSDGTARRVLEQAIGSEDEGRVLMSLELLARDRGAKLEPHLVKLLEHRSARVRYEAAVRAGNRGAQSCAVKLAQLAASDEPLVREAAIFAVAQLRPFTAARILAPLLVHPDLGTRAAAIAALVPLDPAGPPGKALQELIDRGSEAMPGERAQVARLLGRLGGGVYARRLKAYLHDPTAIVRRAACKAAGECREPALIDDLLELLVGRETRVEARQALASYGDVICDRIELLLNDRGGVSNVRYRLPRVLRGIGTTRALEVILFSNPADDPFLQFRLSMAASRIRERDPDVVFDRRRAVQASVRRLDSYEALLPTFRDLEAALGPRNVLVRAVHDRLDQYLESAVRLIGLVLPQRQVHNAFNRFIHGDAKTRPYAIELLEHTIEDGTLARPLIALLERWHGKPDWNDEGRLNRAAERLFELVQTRDVVLRAIAIATARQLAVARGTAQYAGSGEPQKGRGSGVHALARIAKGPSWDAFWANPPEIPEEGPVSEMIVEKVLFLEGVDIFAESDVDDLAAVAQYVRERTFRAGEFVFHENDPGDALYVIIEGQVTIEKERRHILDLGPRDSFGETSLLDNKPRPATARAVTDLRVLVLDRADFMDLVSDRVELLRGIFGAITQQLRSVLDAAAAGRITSPGHTPVSMGKAKTRTG